MSEEYYQLNFGKYFKSVYRHKWIVVLCLCISISLASLIGRNEPPLYQARISFWVREMKGDVGLMSEKIKQFFFLGRQEPFETTYGTQIAIMKSSLILEDVAKRVGLPSKTKRALRDSVKLIRSSIIVSKIRDTTIIEVKAIDPSPDTAVNMANAVCQSYVEFNNKLVLEQEQIKLKSMEEQARVIRKQMGKTNDLITERIKGDMYMLLMEKIAESRLNLSLGQSDRIKVIDKAEEAVLVPVNRSLKIFFMGILGLFTGTVLALSIDTFTRKKKGPH